MTVNRYEQSMEGFLAVLRPAEPQHRCMANGARKQSANQDSHDGSITAQYMVATAGRTVGSSEHKGTWPHNSMKTVSHNQSLKHLDTQAQCAVPCTLALPEGEGGHQNGAFLQLQNVANAGTRLAQSAPIALAAWPCVRLR